jgi:hypothetical protein
MPAEADWWSHIADMRGAILTADEFDLAVEQAWRNGTTTREGLYMAVLTLVQMKMEHEEWMRWKHGETEAGLR